MIFSKAHHKDEMLNFQSCFSPPASILFLSQVQLTSMKMFLPSTSAPLAQRSLVMESKRY